jgi:hypothetical protein
MMIQITGLSSAPFQTFTIADPNGGGDIKFSLAFRPRTSCWYMDIEFKTFIARGLKIVRGMNILYRHHNQIPFGLSVTVSDNFEPYLINDFQSERVLLYLLTTAEVDEIHAKILEGYTVP